MASFNWQPLNAFLSLMIDRARQTSFQSCSRVIVSGTILGLGGIRTHLALLCRALRSERIEVLVFATGSNWESSAVEALKRQGVKFILPPPALAAAKRLATYYSTLSWPFLIPRSAASLYCIGAGRSHLLLNRFRPKGSVSINHEIVAPPDIRSSAGECAQRLDASVANSEKVAVRMRAWWPEKPIQVIPFLTSDAPMPVPAERSRRPEGPLRVVYLGRLVHQKRPDQLVKRWPELTRHPALAGATLDVYGHDPSGLMLKQLREFVSQKCLSGQVKIHGRYELAELDRILEASDLVVLPSLWEGLPLVLVEAMLRGVPFVATAAGGTEELNQGNPDVCVTGLEWDDFEQGLKQTAVALKRGDIQPRRLHEWAEKRYGFDSVSRKWLRCLLAPRSFFNGHD